LKREAQEAAVSIELVRDLQEWITGQLPQSRGAGLRDIAAKARDGRLAQYLAESDFFEYLEVDPSGLELPRSTGDVNIIENRGFELEPLRFSRLDGNQTLVEYEIEIPVIVEADMALEDAEANRWDWRGRAGIDRVWAEIETVLHGRLEAVFDAYDNFSDLDLRDLVQISPSEPIVDVAGPRTVEPWNVPLPLFE
jgi:hypothetical protein